MARKNRKIRPKELLRIPASMAVIATSGALSASLLSHSAHDSSLNSAGSPVASNLCGGAGAWVADVMYQSAGLAAWVAPVSLLLAGVRIARGVRPYYSYHDAVHATLLTATASIALEAYSPLVTLLGTDMRSGGLAGYWLASLFDAVEPVWVTTSAIVASAALMLSYARIGLGEIRSFVAQLRARTAETVTQDDVAPSDKLRAAAPRIVEGRGAPVPATAAAATAGAPPEPPEHFSALGASEVGARRKALTPVLDGLPSAKLLDRVVDGAVAVDTELLAESAESLVQKLSSFGVNGSVTGIHPGPVVTMYEFEPAPGVKVSKIAGLTDDLTMGMQALSVRIIAPIPGKGVVGIELPNKKRVKVFLREIIESQAFASAGRLPIALGKDIAGEAVVADLARMPHLLVAGATGSGKSVSVNAMILSLLFTYTPEHVRMIMIDPKMIELSVYDGIPHLLLPVVTDSRKAASALKWAVGEMERRYRKMSEFGVRSLDSYNSKVMEREPDEFEIDPDTNKPAHAFMPFIVVIVDELADLMMVAGREVEEAIARLAQKARAAGIHLVIATQRPSVDVITGLIKANFPARIAFKVSSRVDSRTILDTGGAEALLGQGDMLFLPPGTDRLARIHGAFVSDDDVQRVVDSVKSFGPAQYEEQVVQSIEAGACDDDGGKEANDPLYEQALQVGAESGAISVSFIQRKLGVGYNKAAKLLERMERDGFVGPSLGAGKQREFYVARMASRSAQ